MRECEGEGGGRQGGGVGGLGRVGWCIIRFTARGFLSSDYWLCDSPAEINDVYKDQKRLERRKEKKEKKRRECDSF